MFKKEKQIDINFLDTLKNVRKVYDKLPLIRERKRRVVVDKALKYFGWTMVGFFVLAFIFLLFNAVNLVNIFNELRSGKNNIDQAIYFAKEKDFKTANDYSKLAESNFSLAKQNLDGYNNFILDNLFYISEQKNNFFFLVSSIDALSHAMAIGTGIGANLQTSLNNDQSFLKLTKEEKRKVLKILTESTIDFKEIQKQVDFANNELVKVKISGLFRLGEGKITELRDRVSELNTASQKIIPFMELLPKALGYPQKSSFLVILQNSDELRPTGGFIGTYGILQMEDSDFLRMDTHDVYHMDMPVKDKLKIVPPDPLKKYLGVDNWFLRDANWSPDWPSSAQKIEYFFKEENKLLTGKDDINNFNEDFDGVIAITPELITDLLMFTGPMMINGEEYNQDNFVNLLQYKVEKGYVQLGVPSWERKEVIGEITKELKKRIFDLSPVDLYNVFQIVGNNVDKKNLVAYFHDTNLENIALKQGWGGNVIQAAGDYLMVVDANMASLKTDAVIKRRLDYKVESNANGLTSEVKIKYIHSGGFDWKTTRYRTYVRFYVPEGSEFIGADGLDGEKVTTYNELGKTVYTTFVSIEPGTIKEITLKYKLPSTVADSINKNKEYNFYLQKQAGSRYGAFNVDFNFDKKIKSYNPTGLFVKKENDNKINWSDVFETDKKFTVLIK
ncbi:DUF4012 domain-containing protein [Candidatus Parcubacteria bacterium]|nr:DUF4012 domain-containing protein [Patescibacteria group bacterium]MBU4309188.1 DUF4012 domain-containing protein [Patescibacteria group bacterium]MBU4432519.1 DUF4012 domain-containing protein [Patescibacteria group bacterium]MBU4577549.1 DUF4012 domain-containing protein [Patescibacteria group bacterium]MCG2697236.1 DUF4012 domain-containing protein [Candidatus Parcubacteria bacterium]